MKSVCSTQLTFSFVPRPFTHIFRQWVSKSSGDINKALKSCLKSKLRRILISEFNSFSSSFMKIIIIIKPEFSKKNVWELYFFNCQLGYKSKKF